MREVKLTTVQFAAAIASFTVGFVKLSICNGVEHGDCAGSGTLVSIGNVRGILTASHVLENLPDRGQVGIVEFLGETVHFRKRVIEMAEAKKISIGGEACAPDGPDLGFLRLPHASLGWFGGLNSFYNLSKHRNDDANDKPAQHHVDAIVGLVGNRTKISPAERPGGHRAEFEAVFSDGNIVASNIKNGFDFLEFVPKEYADTDLPNNFKGTSGGALWRIFFDVDDQNRAKVGGRQLRGVPFLQTFPSNGKPHTLTCHAMSAVYGLLMDLIAKEWPEEAGR